MAAYLKTYKGWKIEVTSAGTFVATDLGSTEAARAATKSSEKLSDLEKAIDAFANKKKKAKAIPISLPVIGVEGPGTITGVSLHNDRYLGPGLKDNHEVYVDTPYIRAAFARLAELRREISEIETTIAVAEIQQISRYGYAWNGSHHAKKLDSYEAQIEDLKARYTKALLAAEELAERESEQRNGA